MLLGSRDADEIDDAVRDFARDLDERLKDIIKDVLADPWRLKALGGKIRLNWSAGHVSGVALTFEQLVCPSAISSTIRIDLDLGLGIGSVLKSLAPRFLRATAGAIVTFNLYRIDAAGVSTLVVGPVTPANSASIQDVLITNTSVTPLADGDVFALVTTLTSDGASPLSAQLFNTLIDADRVWGV